MFIFCFFYVFETIFIFFCHCVIISLTILYFLVAKSKSIKGFVCPWVCPFVGPSIRWSYFSQKPQIRINLSEFSFISWIHIYNTNFYIFFPLMSTTCVATLVDWLTISTIPTFLTILTILSLLTIPNIPTKFEVGTVRSLN